MTRYELAGNKWVTIIAVILVVFTFAGVNLLLPGLHSYAV